VPLIAVSGAVPRRTAEASFRTGVVQQTNHSVSGRYDIVHTHYLSHHLIIFSVYLCSVFFCFILSKWQIYICTPCLIFFGIWSSSPVSTDSCGSCTLSLLSTHFYSILSYSALMCYIPFCSVLNSSLLLYPVFKRPQVLWIWKMKKLCTMLWTFSVSHTWVWGTASGTGSAPQSRGCDCIWVCLGDDGPCGSLPVRGGCCQHRATAPLGLSLSLSDAVRYHTLLLIDIDYARPLLAQVHSSQYAAYSVHGSSFPALEL
jgi:hypothetical protein